MLQNLLAKVNAKFTICYYVFFGLYFVAKLCDFIYEVTTYNYEVLSYFYFIVDLLVCAAFFGFGAFLLFKKDSARFKTFFTMYIIYIVISNIFSLRSVFGYPMSEYTPATTIVYYILCMLLVLSIFCFAICFFLNKFYPNPLFLTIANIALLVSAALEFVNLIVAIIDVAQGYMGWSSIVWSIESICFYGILLLGINNKEVID